MMPLAKFKVGASLALLTCLAATSSYSFAQDTLQVAASAADQQFLARAEDLLTAGDATTAYSLLSEKEVELAGNPFFDYLLGVAALDSGRVSDAIFSLRRALAVAPGFSGARMELARAYFETGNMSLSRPLFVQLLDEQPPAAVRAVINDYIASIDASPSAPRGSFSTYFDLAAGYDTNANGSTDSQQFLGFMLSPNNVETESSFAELGAGLSWSKPTSTRFAWYANGRVGFRHNPDAGFVDSGILNGAGGMNWQRGSFFGRAGIDAYLSTRDGDSNQSYAGLDTLLGRRLNQSWDVSIGIRGGALRYDNSIDIMDVNRVMFTGRLGRNFSSGGSFGIELVGGNDSERRSSSPYGNSKLGGRVTLYAPMSNDSMLFVSSGSLTSDYDDLFFGTPREDTQISTLLQIEFRNLGIEGLSLTPRLRHVDNDSDVAALRLQPPGIQSHTSLDAAMKPIDTRRARLLLFFLPLLIPGVSVAADAGSVLFAKGTVTAERAPAVALAKGDAVLDDDTIATGDASRAQLLMIDGAKIAIRPNSILRIDEYAYTESAATVVSQSNNKSVMSLVKGGFRTITGAVGKEDRSDYESAHTGWCAWHSRHQFCCSVVQWRLRFRTGFRFRPAAGGRTLHRRHRWLYRVSCAGWRTRRQRR